MGCGYEYEGAVRGETEGWIPGIGRERYVSTTANAEPDNGINSENPKTHIRNIQPPKCHHTPLLFHSLDCGLSCVPTCTDKHAILALLTPYLTQGIVATFWWRIHIDVPSHAWLGNMEIGEVVLPELAYEVGELWYWVRGPHICARVGQA